MQEEQTIKRKRGQRGLGKEPAMVKISLRVPADTLEFYKGRGASNAMREALIEGTKNTVDNVNTTIKV